MNEGISPHMIEAAEIKVFEDAAHAVSALPTMQCATTVPHDEHDIEYNDVGRIHCLGIPNPSAPRKRVLTEEGPPRFQKWVRQNFELDALTNKEYDLMLMAWRARFNSK